MNELERALTEIGANNLAPLSTMHKQSRLLCEQNESLFNKVVKNKPDSPVTNHLLGIMTKCHIEQTALLEGHLDSVHQMQLALEQSLGKNNAQKFENQSVSHLMVTTHVWLYIQGYLNMDYSLASDHAQNTAQLISAATGVDSQSCRSQFMESFYQGKTASPVKSQPNPLFGWLKKLFN